MCVQYATHVHSVGFGSTACRDIDESDKEMTGVDRRTDGIKFLHNFPHLEATLTGWKVFTVSFSEAYRKYGLFKIKKINKKVF